MTSKPTASLALFAAALVAGCATDPQTASSSEPPAPREYRTGSNIPVREPRSTGSSDKARVATPADAPPATAPAVKPAN